MSGHSKWSTIKRQKGVNDSKRSAMFTKVAREVAVAARAGGGDPDANYRLRLAVEKARAINMPAENIKRAIEKATGGGDAEQFEEIVYEGYGPGGVAVLVEAATDNRNRTAAEVRSMFAKAGGQLAGSGAVAWQFEPRGLITVHRGATDPDEIALAAIDAGLALGGRLFDFELRGAGLNGGGHAALGFDLELDPFAAFAGNDIEVAGLRFDRQRGLTGDQEFDGDFVRVDGGAGAIGHPCPVGVAAGGNADAGLGA